MTVAKGFYGWKLVCALWIIIIVNLGLTNYGAGVINAAMAKDLNLGRGTLGLGFTVFVIAAGLSSPLAAKLVNSIGARLTLLCGSSMVAFGAFLLASWASHGWHYVLAFGVLVGMGCGLGAMIPAQTCVAMWFEKKRAFAMAVVLTGAGAGGFIAAPLLTRLIAAEGGNWRAGWYFVLAAALSTGVVSLLFVRNRPADCGQLPDGGVANAAGRDAGGRAPDSRSLVYRTRDIWTVREAARTRAMWLIGLAAIGFIVPNTAVLAHGISHLRDLGQSAEAAARAFGLLALCSVFGKLGAGFLCDRMEPRYVWFACNLITATGVLMATQASSVVAMYLFAILLGVGAGASLTCWPAMVANYFGPAGFASVLGSQLPFTNIFAAISPFLVGVAYDAQGTYTTALYVIAAFGAVTAVLLLAAAAPSRRRRRIEGLSAATAESKTL